MTTLLPYFLDLQAKAIAEAEIEIIRTLVIDTLIAGNSVSLGPVMCSRDLDAIMGAVTTAAFIQSEAPSGSSPSLFIHSDKGAQLGCVQLKFGSQGWDVMTGYTPRIEPLMSNAQALVEIYAKKFLMET